MSSIRALAPALVAAATDPIPGAPDAALTLRPDTQEAVAETLRVCSEQGLSVLVWGAGTHQSIGHAVMPDVVLSTERLDRIVDHQPEDMTLVVEAGVRLGAIEALLAAHGQMAILPETGPDATVGGVLAAGISGYRRSRFGPTRDHLLEVTLATGDGRVVRGGGRVVKNVQGFDLMRLAVGSLGSLGVILQVCLKLWPDAPARSMVRVEDPQDAKAAYRPWAVLETAEGTTVYLAGTDEELTSQAERLGNAREAGHHWPTLPAEETWSVRVPPALTGEAVERLPKGAAFIAQHGVGVVDAAITDPGELRSWAEGVAGSVVRITGEAAFDPWGTPPSTLQLQRRLIARFDPDRIVNPGRLPGGI